MSNKANLSAKNFRINKGTPKGGESAVATLSRALIDPLKNEVAWEVDANGNLIRRRVYENFLNYDTTDQVTILGMTGLAFATTTALVHQMYTPGGNIFNVANIGVQTTPPAIIAGGLDVGGVQTDDIGMELFTHVLGASGGTPYVIGNSPAFYLKVKFSIEDVSGTDDLHIGFRRASANNLTFDNYTDLASIGVISGAITIETIDDNAATTSTDTTDTWADGATKTLEVYVSATGVVTYKINGVAPTATAAFTFDNGDPVIPFFHTIHAADLAGAITILEWESGLQ